MVLQRCTVCSGLPPEMLCTAVQELHMCLTSMIESGNLVDLEMLDMAEGDPVTPTSRGRALSTMTRAEPPVGVTAPSQPTTSKPEEAAPPKELTLVPRWRPPAPPGLSLSWADESDSPTPEKADWPMSIPLEAQLDFASLGSIQVTILHFAVKGKVHCEYQFQTVALTSLTQMPLQLAQAKPLDQPDSMEEFWANEMLFTWPTSDYTTPRLLGSDQECVVSSFMSMTSTSKHDEASLIIEQSDVAQHMHVHLPSHWDHSVFIHHVFVNFFWWTGQSFYMIIKPCCVPMNSLY